ncbi:ADP compounds hydrolase NudE [Pasteurellaceae bacterium HPA106]|uniref:ADP compounds hydrolase NudE n=1 Tax=Spirabiliibacterium pneumoniae TaxID=221400 RepID=UPI001AAD2C2E|nr:ADP compounds hydrolase NudE [Spirabiliibacterium pneumoniae]MBE2897075.1 ADP compounds hydrolase NudE [Spirabiliibacterium pneumoniae]
MAKKYPNPAILEVRELAKTRLFCVQAVDLRFANGACATYERLRPSLRGAVTVLAIDGSDLLLVNEYSVGTERYELGFVKGRIDEGETPEQSAVRELQEEIGFKPAKVRFLRTLSTNPGYMNSPMHLFLAWDLTPSTLVGDEPQPLELVRVPLAQIDELLAREEFNEARNLTALYLLRDFLKEAQWSV